MSFLNQQLRFNSWSNLHDFQLSNPSFIRTSIFQSWQSNDVCPISRSTVEICFATPSFGDFNYQPSRSPRTLLVGVHRFLPRVLLKSMTLVCFGTSRLSTKTGLMTLGALLYQRSRFTSGILCFHSLLSSGVFHTWSSRSVDACPRTDRRYSTPLDLRVLGISYLNFASFTISQRVFPWTAQMFATRPSGNRRPGSSSALGSSTFGTSGP